MVDVQSAPWEAPAVPDRPTKSEHNFQTAPLPWDVKAAEIEARAKELRMREEELKAREHNVRQRETIVGETSGLVKNWPRLYPIATHYIELEIPEASQSLVNQSYLLWKMTALGYLVNLIGTTYFFFARISGYASITGVIAASIYLVLCPLLAFFGWHKSLYNALKSEGGIWWYLAYFIAFAGQLVFYGFLGVGFISGGAGGLIATIDMIASGSLIGAILAGCGTAIMVFNLLAGIYLIQAVARHYKEAGGLQRTGEAAISGAARNDTVRSAAKNAIVNSIV